MLLALGVIIIFATLLFIFYAIWHGKLENVWTIGAVAVVGGAFAAVVPNLPDLSGLVLDLGEKGVYGLRVEKAVQEVQKGVSEARELKGQIEELVKRVEENEQAVKQADQELDSIQQQQEPRTLSDEQKQSLITVLSPFKGQKVSIEVLVSNDESKKFARSLIPAFSEAGWDFENPPGTYPGVKQVIYPDRDPVGIEVTLNKEEVSAGRSPPAAQALVNAFIQMGFLERRRLFVHQAIPAGRIVVRVGNKPSLVVKEKDKKRERP